MGITREWNKRWESALCPFLKLLQCGNVREKEPFSSFFFVFLITLNLQEILTIFFLFGALDPMYKKGKVFQLGIGEMS